MKHIFSQIELEREGYGHRTPILIETDNLESATFLEVTNMGDTPVLVVKLMLISGQKIFIDWTGGDLASLAVAFGTPNETFVRGYTAEAGV